MMYEKVCYIVIAALCVLLSIALAGFGIQTRRLDRRMAELGQLRGELEAAYDRESDIRETVGRAGAILGESAGTVSELREQLKEIEKSYDDLVRLLARAYDSPDSGGGE